jgi:hypothetical protein
MYTATMHYQFTEDDFERACQTWRTEVMEHAKTRPGFVRMQFLVAGRDALAIGTWENRDYARAFMETGVFKKLLEKLEGMTTARPTPKVWDLKYFEEK